MHKKLIHKVVVIAMAATLITGCAVKSPEVKTTEGLPQDSNVVVDSDSQGEVIDVINETPDEVSVPQGITVNQIKYDVIDVSTLPEQLASEIDTLKLQKGYAFWPQEDGSFLILISAGEKMTGGYEIAVEAMEDNEGKTIITVKESEPSGDMNTEVITYPYVLVKASQITDNFIIHDQNQVEYKRLEADTQTDANADVSQTTLRIDPTVIDYSKPVVGTYQGLIDNNSIEVLVGDVHVSFYADDITKYLEGIETGDTIEVKASIAPTDQIIVESIEKVR